jgi:tetratricopeptide (TPR) repeat protein
MNLVEVFDEALTALNQTLQLNSSDSSALRMSSYIWHEKAFGLQNSNKYEEALSAINQAIQFDQNLDPVKSAEIWNTKASILNNLKRYDEALTALNQTLQINPKDRWALQNKPIIVKQLTDSGNSTAQPSN